MALARRGGLPGGEGRQVRELHETILSEADIRTVQAAPAPALIVSVACL